MKKVTLYSILCLLLVGTIYSCSKDEGQEDVCEQVDSVVNFSIRFNPVLNGKELELEKIEEDVNGYPLFISKMKFYLAKIKLVDTNGDDHLLRDAALITYEIERPEPEAKELVLKMIAPAGKYKGVKFDIGVGEDNNYNDPGIYERTHPLSISNLMHWDWNSGYIFLKIEGKVDTMDDGKIEPAQSISLHTGLSKLYKSIDLEGKEFTISKDKEKEIVVKVDLDKFFKSDDEIVDFATENVTNASNNNPELAVKFAEFYSKAFSLE